MTVSIMVVEDHSGVRAALREWLENALPDSLVIEAASGEEAIGLLQNYEPHLVLMDYKLPGMNGFEATRRIKRRLPSTHIVVLSIREESIYNAYAFAAGASAYITKRAMFASLLPTLSGLLSITQITGNSISDT